MLPSHSEKPAVAAAGPGLGRLDLLIIAGLAALPRLSGLGHVSLWLDEILGTLQTSGSFAESWTAMRGVRVHPPFWGLLNWLSLRVTDSEPLRRLLPIAFGVATVLLLADLTARCAGRRVGWAAGVIAALSPLHIRFSQELRPYSLGLLALVLTVWLARRAAARDRPADFALLALAIWVCLASLYVAALALLPATLLAIDAARSTGRARRTLLRLGLAIGLALLAFSPWLGIVGEALAQEHELGATRWTLDLLARRWQYLTVGSADGEAAGTACLLAAGFALVGALAAMRHRFGRAALATALAATLGVELVLVATDHWTNGRYSIVAWPFLVILLALGCVRVGELASRSSRRPRRSLELGWVAAAVVALAAAEAAGGVRYLANGRPDWAAVAADVERIAGEEGPIWVANEWTRVSLGYYLARLESAPRGALSQRVRVAPAAPPPPAPGSCGALVVAGFPERADLDPLFLRSPAQLRFPRTGARLLTLPPAPIEGDARDPWRCFPSQLDRLAGEREPSGFAALFAPSARLESRLDLDTGDAHQLLFGWSFAERDREGRPFRWALGEWTATALPARTGGHLRLRAWPFGAHREVTVYRDRAEVGRIVLSGGPADYQIAWPVGKGLAAESIVHFRFDGWAEPDRNPRPLAAGFAGLELVP